MSRTVLFVSDRTGITAETLGHSLLSQFPDIGFEMTTLRFIDTPDKARAVAAGITARQRRDGARPIVFSTLIDADIRAIVAASGCAFFDLVDTYIAPLEAELGQHSSHSVGRTHGLGDEQHYSERMDAVSYSLATDDGTATRDYDRADVIVLGVSRSGKTPTCLYLALKYGIHAANYPLLPEDLDRGRLPAVLNAHRARLFGLSIDPQRLHQIREQRQPHSDYAALRTCQYEVRQVEALYRQENIPHINSTSMSVEELAAQLMHQLGR